MEPLTEEAFRELLDDHGVLRPGAMARPDRLACFSVFAQRADVAIDIEGLKRQAQQFFATKLGLTVDKHYGELPPAADAARIVISSADAGASGTRLCYGCAVDPSDFVAADEAERAIGTYGLALLARRCKTIWTIIAESSDDRVALSIAAVFASTLLGPILSPGGSEIYGVRGARLKLEGRASPYR